MSKLPLFTCALDVLLSVNDLKYVFYLKRPSIRRPQSGRFVYCIEKHFADKGVLQI